MLLSIKRVGGKRKDRMNKRGEVERESFKRVEGETKRMGEEERGKK